MTAEVATAELAELFSRVRTAAPIAVAHLELVPLLLEACAGDPDADLLEEGVGAGVTRVTEVDLAGSVNRVRVEHHGARLLLLVDGEQISGAKQNRIVNASFLVPPGVAADIPVSCVERGRWSYRSQVFEATEVTLCSSARASKLSRVTTSLSAGQGYDAVQGAVWRDVDRYLERSHVTSVTGAYSDGYRTRAATVEALLGTLAPAPGQVGIAAVYDGRLVALDVFASAALFGRCWRKVARGILAETYAPTGTGSDARAVVEAALFDLAKASATRTPAPGCGETLHGVTESGVFGAVAYEGRIYHAVVAAA